MAKCKVRLRSGRSGREAGSWGSGFGNSPGTSPDQTLQQGWDLWWFGGRDLESALKFQLQRSGAVIKSQQVPTLRQRQKHWKLICFRVNSLLKALKNPACKAGYWEPAPCFMYRTVRPEWMPKFTIVVRCYQCPVQCQKCLHWNWLLFQESLAPCLCTFV